MKQENKKDYFNSLIDQVLNEVAKDEFLTVNLKGEETLFHRFNGSRIRQSTDVEQFSVELSLQNSNKQVKGGYGLTLNFENDFKNLVTGLKELRAYSKMGTPTPFMPQVPEKEEEATSVVHTGALPSSTQSLAEILEVTSGYDFCGIYTSGKLFRAHRNSLGGSHWFESESFYVDYSLFSGTQSVKKCYAGSDWDLKAFDKSLKEASRQLQLLERPMKKLSPGSYRTYLTPMAVNDLVSVLKYGGVSFSALKEKRSPLLKLHEGKESLSSEVTFLEDYSLGLSPRFNERGSVVPSEIVFVEQGQAKNLLVSPSSAKKYDVKSNNANDHEFPVNLSLKSGQLVEDKILQSIDKGLYISSAWYVNWSNLDNAQLTGTTRYACFWVENGEIVQPIDTLRFDESLYHILGDGLLGITDFTEVSPSTSSYGRRADGGSSFPGLLVDNFNYTQS